MMKILIIFGTRPEAIKMAPLVKEFQKHRDRFKTFVCVTGQHRKMLDQVLSIFEIVPDVDLNIMKPGQDLTDLTTLVLAGVRDVIKKVLPDIVLVHGDTTTSSAAALAAFYQQIPVGHIEAGLRTYNIYSPWPEEINRQITARISTWHFAPTLLNKKNLMNEAILEHRIFVTGNTVIDALHFVVEKIKNTRSIKEKIEEDLVIQGLPKDLINCWEGVDGERRMVLITGHRRENFGEGFKNICEAINALAKEHKGVDFVYPVHLNPNVQKQVKEVLEMNGKVQNKNVYLLEPLEYLTFIYLMQKCALVLTDSGGIQEEAPSLNKPVVVMRNETERQEGLSAGTLTLSGTRKKDIFKVVSQLLTNHRIYKSVSRLMNPYGDGKAALRIVNYLIENISKS